MKYQELLILLPCHSLEDFPAYHEGEDAQSLLASWSALWHPALIASAGQAPAWRRIEDPPSDVRQRLIVVPSICVQRLPTGFAQRVKDEGGVLIRKTGNRQEILQAALEPFVAGTLRVPSNEGQAASQGDGTRSVPATLDPELAADFLALGYCYLQIELLTRQMRYSSNLDETYFKSTVVAAANAAVEGNVELAREKLAACFSVLAEERDHYYPVDAFVLDLNLAASTTLGESLRTALLQPTATNLLIKADLVAEMAIKEPGTLAALKDAIAAGRVGLIGGEASEVRLPLMSHESIAGELRRSLSIYNRHLGCRPAIYGRWRYGLTPHLPGILHKLGFKGALHAGFEEGKVPDGLQFKVRWEGLDGSAIDAIARTPLDASKPQTFLALATKLGESMDSDHVATLCLAHWPGQACEWLDDLRRISRYCGALGKWVTVDEYFAKTDQPGQLDRFEPDRYRSPYLKQAIIRKQEDPISGPVRYWDEQSASRDAVTMETLATAVQGRARAEGAIDQLSEERLAEVLTAANPSGPKGVLILNPCSFVRRLGAEGIDLSGLPTVERPVYAAEEADGRVRAVVDVPAFGFVHLTQGKPAAKEKKPILLAQDNTLRNEFFEAIINPTTGSLAAIHEYKTRGNRLSQQLALRSPGPRQKPGDTYRDESEAAVYSVMAADSLDTTIATTTLGEIVTRGRLLDLEGRRLAGFTQRYRLWRGSRVLQVEIELDPVEEPKADPWNSYYCIRLAWADELAELFRTVNETRQAVTEKRFESPLYIDLASEKQSTTILTGGLTFHQRQADSRLDTLLISRGERERKFRFGIGVDLSHPLHDALGTLSPPVIVPGVPQPASGNSGWLLHLSSRNVIATSLMPLEEEGRVNGLRVRLLETAGRPANLTITAFRTLQSASTVDFLGHRLADCSIEEGKVKLDLAAHEWVEVVARW
jgi:alpha-mannosidase